jgi:hypothetical protein
MNTPQRSGSRGHYWLKRACNFYAFTSKILRIRSTGELPVTYATDCIALRPAVKDRTSSKERAPGTRSE